MVFAVTPVVAEATAASHEHGAQGAGSAGGFIGQHLTTGTVTSIDKDEGNLSLDAEGHTLDLHFPKTALQNIEKGDRVTVELAIKQADATAGTRGRAGTHDTSGAAGGANGPRSGSESGGTRE